MPKPIPVARYAAFGDPYIRFKLSDGRVLGEHRYLVECRLGRRLRRNEHVHHKDGNPRNNSLSNLELLSASEHIRKHRDPAPTVTLTCPACRRKFERTLRYVVHGKKVGRVHFFCSRSCRTSKFGGAPPDDVHGTAQGYGYWKCRCSVCREGHRMRHLAWRKRSRK